MRFEDVSWMDVEEYLKCETRVMVVLGSCEQHGYLSLLTDTKIPMALADAASQQTDVLIAPPLPIGCSPYFLDYPGTLSLRVETLIALLEDFIQSLYHSGFRKILILNGHGGNSPAMQKAFELVNSHSDLKIAWYTWWDAHSVEIVAQKYGLKPYHASWSENFRFVRVGQIPEGEKNPPAYQGILNASQTRSSFGDGIFGGKYQAEDTIMQEIFDEALKDILQLLKF